MIPHEDYYYFIFNKDYPLKAAWFNVIQETDYSTIRESVYPDTDNNDAYYYIVKAVKTKVPQFILDTEPFKSAVLTYSQISDIVGGWQQDLWDLPTTPP